MPRRNLLILFLVAVVAVLCRQRVQSNPYPRVLGNAMTKIDELALDPVGDQKLFEGAMYGMLSQFDENTMYLPPQQQAAFNQALDLQFAGIGIKMILDPKTKQLIVGYPLVGSPASQAGMLVGDKIVRINGTSTRGMSLRDAFMLLRGEPGTKVTLSVVHPGDEKPIDLTLLRNEVQETSVIGDTCQPNGDWNYFLDGHDKIGYLRITCFTERTASELHEAIKWLLDHGMRGLVLDFRGDPGGYLPAAVAVCNLFVDKGEIVTTRGRNGVVGTRYVADGNAPFSDIPIALVVNQDTASAAEIVAACLQDHHRAKIVGQRTFGKGTVQELIDLGPGCGGMKLTTKSYWRPSGKDIRRPPGATDKGIWGVSPDKDGKLVLTKKEHDRWQAWRNARDLHQPLLDELDDNKNPKPFVDRQLQRAVESVEKEISQRKTP